MRAVSTPPVPAMAARPKPSPDKPAPSDPPKSPDRPHLDAPDDAKPRTTSKTMFVQLARQAELRDLVDMPNTPKRREEAVRRMREFASVEQDTAIREMKEVLERQGMKDAKVEVNDRLWITNGMQVTISGLPGGMMGMSKNGKDTGADKLVSALENLGSIEDVATMDDLQGAISVPAVAKDSQQTPAGRSAKLPWNLSQIHANSAWKAGVDGSGVTVANVDTGVDVQHPALWSKFKGYSRDGFGQEKAYYDATVAQPKVGDTPPDPKDYNGHGTHTMGTMVGADGQGTPVGVAPGAKFIAAAGLGEGGGDVLGLLKALQFVTAPSDGWNQIDPKSGADIVNNSWGGRGPETSFTTALRNMAAAGVVNVFAAGNNGMDSKDQNLGDPGMWTDAITVGAVNKHKEVSAFSSKGPSPVTDEFKPFVVAPGEGVESTIPNGKYATFSGTSMAAPHVAGALALVDQELANRKQTKMDLDDAKFVLQRMAKDIAPKGPDDASGYGIIDLAKMKSAVDALVKARAAQ